MLNQTRKQRDVMVHLRLPENVLAVIEPQAEHEGLRLPSWIRRVLVLAARESSSKQMQK